MKNNQYILLKNLKVLLRKKYFEIIETKYIRNDT